MIYKGTKQKILDKYLIEQERERFKGVKKWEERKRLILESEL